VATVESPSSLHSRPRDGDGRRARMATGTTIGRNPLPASPIVLARIPNMDATPAATATEVMLSPHEFRFDPPQTQSEGPRYRGLAAPPQTVNQRPPHAPPAENTSAAAFQQTQQRSPLLPAKNLFDPFPSVGETSGDRLSPAAQFLLLFVLFTAAGTSLLSIGRSSTGGGPADTSAEHRVEQIDPALAVPTAVTQSPAADALRPVEAPTAMGPAGDVPRVRPGSPSWPNYTGEQRVTSPTDEAVPVVTRTAERPADFGTHKQPQPERVSPTESRSSAKSATDQQVIPYPSTNVPPAELPTAVSSHLPQVQTGDPPTAIAKLRGVVNPVIR
jgi:hypothetical protein